MKPALRDDASTVTQVVADEALAARSYGLDDRHLERALYDGAREFLGRPSKAFRARLLEASFAIAGGEGRALPPACCEALELLHAGSLIVDDIEDETATRRGAPALHKLIGIPRALNTGNWLYFVALSRLDQLELSPVRAQLLTRAVHRCLARCHEGQALDLTLRISEVRRSEVAAIAHATSVLKTGALMGLAAFVGAIVAGAPEAIAEELRRFGERMGVGLQMLDDLGSFVAPGRADKGNEDLRGQRVGWAWAWASEVLDELPFKHLARQTARNEDLDEVRTRLALAIEELGRARISETLRAALQELEAALGQSQALDHLTTELTRLEKSYG
jgi:geranylgeranyl pyrophosphate synthase